MTTSSRRPRVSPTSSQHAPVPWLIALGVLAAAALLLAEVEYRVGHRDAAVISLAAAVGGACTILTFGIVSTVLGRLLRSTRLQAARMRATMSAMKDGVCCVDERGRLTYMNPAAERMLGRTFEAHAGEAIAAVFPLEHREEHPTEERPKLISAVLAGDTYAGRDAVACDGGAVLFVDVRVAPIMLRGERAGAVITFSDDADRTREEQAKDDFVGFASHELRSPLTAMHGFSSWLATKLEREPWRFDADTAEAIAALASETGRMESIIELFLDLTQIRMDRLSLEPGLVDLAKLLREEVAAVRSRYPGAATEEQLPATRTLAIVDEQRLRQVVLNLLDNAAKYGGTNPRIVLSLSVSDGTAELRVRDFGSGIPREDQRHLFERFFRSPAPATAQKKGFGIGLYVTKQLVDRMGGELSFASEEGHGTEFTVRLPLLPDEMADAEGEPVDELTR